MRRDFVANVSHEFKTPLTSIRGYAETLLSGALSDPKNAADFIRIIERNAKNLETLVTDLLMLARLEAELPVAMEPINLKSVIDEQLASRQSTIAERQITVSNDCTSDEVRSDRTRLSAAVSNLIDNAIYYNRPKGKIRITGGTTNGFFQISIADTGQGIPSEELPRIFERFYRVDKARSRETGRTGLGLSIVKHAIESLGGSITVTSRIGTGSTFTIKLPKE
jgi:two-component system phosphate regulon sensor histidine kinase PhoR